MQEEWYDFADLELSCALMPVNLDDNRDEILPKYANFVTEITIMICRINMNFQDTQLSYCIFIGV